MMSEHRQGPVRSEAARTAILEATAKLFVERGYDNLTIEGVAHEAGVAKQTIYRWWTSRGALVSDCLLSGMLLPERLAPPDSGDIRSDLIAWLTGLSQLLEEPSGDDVVRSLIAAAAENIDVGRRLHESLGAQSSVTARIQSGIHKGQLRPDASAEDIGEMLVGAVILRALSRAPFEPGLAARMVDTVLRTS